MCHRIIRLPAADATCRAAAAAGRTVRRGLPPKGRAVEGVGDGAGQIVEAGLDDGLHRGRQIGAVVGEHRGAGAHLRRRDGAPRRPGSRRRTASRAAGRGPRRARAARRGARTRRARCGTPAATGSARRTRGPIPRGFGKVAAPAHQRRARPRHRAREHRFALDLGVAREQRTVAGASAAARDRPDSRNRLRHNQFEGDRPGARRALRRAGAARTAEISGPAHSTDSSPPSRASDPITSPRPQSASSRSAR